MKYIKKDENTLEAIKTIPQEIIPEKQESTEYKRSFLDEQKVRVDEDLANTIARHAKELAQAQANVDEVDALLLECEKLGIK